MAKISDLLTKAKNKLKWVWASIADAVTPATPSILAKDTPTSSDIGGGGVSLFEAQPWEKVKTLGEMAREWLESANKYIESSPTLSSFASEDGTRNMINKAQEFIVDKPAEFIGSIAPIGGEYIEKWLKWAWRAVTAAPWLLLDTKENFSGFTDALSKWDKSEAARKLLDLGTSSIGAAFSATPFGLWVRALAWGGMWASWASGAVQWGKENIAKSVSSLLWTNEKETLDWVSSLADAASTAAGIKGAKISQYKPTDLFKTKTANLLKWAAVGSSADAFVAMFDTGEGKDKAVQWATMFLINAFPSPLEAPKGTGKKPKISEAVKPADVTPPKWMDITDTKAVEAEVKAPKKWKFLTIEEVWDENLTTIKSDWGELTYALRDGKMEIDWITVGEKLKWNWTLLMKEAEKQAKNLWVDTIRLNAVPTDWVTTKEGLDTFYTKLWFKKLPDFETVYEKPVGKKKVSSVVKDTEVVLPEEITTEQPVKPTEEVTFVDTKETPPEWTKLIQEWVKPHIIPNAKYQLTLWESLAKARWKIAANTTIKALLNNVIVKWASWKGEKLANYITGIKKWIFNDVARNVVKDIAITDKEVADAKFKDIDSNILLDGVTPEWTVVSRSNINEFKKTFNSIKDEQLGAQISDLTEWFLTKNRTALQKASYVYDLIKNNPEKVQQVFTDKQRALIERIDSQEKAIYQRFVSYLKDRWVLKWDESDDYIRYVMWVIGFDRIKALWWAPEKYYVTNGTKTYSYDNLLDAQRAIESSKAIKGQKEFKFTEETAGKLNSLSKEKWGVNLEMFRTHGAFNRLLSYAESIGRLESDYQVGKTLQEAIDSNKVVGDYLNQWLKGEGNQNVLSDILGLWMKPDSTPAKVAWFLGNLGTALQMAGNTLSLTAQWVSTWIKMWARVGTMAVKDAFTNPLSLKDYASLPIFKSQALKNWASAEWFNTSYEIMPWSNKDFMNKALSVGMELGTANRLIENPAKSYLSMVLAKRILRDKYGTAVSTEQLPAMWNKFKQEDVEGYKMAHDKILDSTNWISDVSSLAKLNLGWDLTRNLLGKIKTYTIDQLDSNIRDTLIAWDAGLKALFGKNMDEFDKQYGAEAAKRVATWAAVTGLMFAYLYNKYSSETEDETDSQEEAKVKKDLAQVRALDRTMKFAWPTILNDLIGITTGEKFLPSLQSLGGAVAESPIWLWFDLLATAYNTTVAPEDKKYYELIRWLTTSLKWAGAWRSAMEYGSMLWFSPDSPDFRNKTRYLYDKSFSDRSTFDKLTGYNPNTVVESFLRNQIGELSQEDTGIIQDVTNSIVNYVMNSSILTDIDVFGQEVGTSKQWIYTGYDAFDITNNINKKKYQTVDELLQGENILDKTNPQYDSLKTAFIQAIVDRDAKAQTSISANNAELKSNTPMDLQYKALPTGTWSPLTDEQAIMNWLNGTLKDDNPRLYTDIIALMAKLKNPEKVEWEIMENSLGKVLENWKAEGNQSNPLIDWMVADSLGKQALSDTLTAAMNKERVAIEKLMWNLLPNKWQLWEKGKQFILWKLKLLDTIYWVADSVWASENALPADSFNWKWLLEKVSKWWMADVISNIWQQFPNLYDTLYKWLTLRGEQPITKEQTWAGTLSQMVEASKASTQVQPTTPTTPTPTSSSELPQPFTPTKWTKLKNEWKWALPESKATKSRTHEPKIKKTSLSEMLSRSRQ